MQNDELLKIVGIVLLVVILIVGLITLDKVNKLKKNSGMAKMGMMGRLMRGRKVGDIGPPAAGGRVNLPPNSPFIGQCQSAFASGGCAGDGATMTVCGDAQGVNACQDYTNPNDFSCSQSPYVAYQASDCSAPMNYVSGEYLCDANAGPNSACAPVGSGSAGISGPAPPNPWGCRNVCGGAQPTNQ